MKRLVLHIYIMFMALTAMACPSNEVKLVQDWDKTFPKSEKVNHERVTFKTQYGFTLAADLYIPKNAEGKLPAIAVSGPFGAVKEQCSGLYAQGSPDDSPVNEGSKAMVMNPRSAMVCA